jgi:hypothetical protein
MASKPKLKLGFTDYYPTMDDFFMDTLSQTFDIERNDEAPDYLIFADETFGENNKRFNKSNVIKIFFTGENERPWEYYCHHAISFEHLDGPQFYRLPLYVLDNWVQTKNGVSNALTMRKNYITAEEKEHFCGFVASNPSSAYRNKIFHMLNEYKPVLSGGALFNNIGGVLPRDVNSKIQFFRKCKFSLCFENSSWPGYCTEKLMHGFIADTVPIYWGSPTVEMDFNPDAMISRHNFESDIEFVDWIIHLDNNNDLWQKVVNTHYLDGINHFHHRNWDLNRFNRWFLNNVYKGVRS